MSWFKEPKRHALAAKGIKTKLSPSQMMQRRVSITPLQRDRFFNIGTGLIKKKLITGFQIEDFKKDRSAFYYYAHTDKRHLEEFLEEAPGIEFEIYPRISGYLYNPEWGKPSAGTTVKDGFASEKGYWVKIRGDIKKISDFVNNKATDRKKGPYLYDSWEVPDARIINKSRMKDYRKVKNIIVPIDENSRFSSIVKASSVNKIMQELKNERVRDVLVQDFKPKENSFYFNLVRNPS